MDAITIIIVFVVWLLLVVWFLVVILRKEENKHKEDYCLGIKCLFCNQAQTVHFSPDSPQVSCRCGAKLKLVAARILDIVKNDIKDKEGNDVQFICALRLDPDDDDEDEDAQLYLLAWKK